MKATTTNETRDDALRALIAQAKTQKAEKILALNQEVSVRRREFERAEEVVTYWKTLSLDQVLNLLAQEKAEADARSEQQLEEVRRKNERAADLINFGKPAIPTALLWGLGGVGLGIMLCR